MIGIGWPGVLSIGSFVRTELSICRRVVMLSKSPADPSPADPGSVRYGNKAPYCNTSFALAVPTARSYSSYLRISHQCIQECISLYCNRLGRVAGS